MDLVHCCRISIIQSVSLAMLYPATVVEMKRESAVAAVGNIIYLELNRPFVYLIMDSSTQLPVFSGIYQGE